MNDSETIPAATEVGDFLLELLAIGTINFEDMAPIWQRRLDRRREPQP